MQITFNNDFNSAGVQFTPDQINSFLADEQTAENMIESTFTNNISVVYDVGFGSYRGQPLQNQNVSLAFVNENALFPMTYTQLRNDLLTFGQPGFFNDANLPPGPSLNGRTNFWVSSSIGACFGLFTQATDGFVGIGTQFAPGNQRVSAFLHEVTHAMARVDANFTINGQTYFSSLDLVRFLGPNNRLFDGHSPSHPESPAAGIFFARRRRDGPGGLGCLFGSRRLFKSPKSVEPAAALQQSHAE
jgi:hypothetical protein